MGNSPAFQYYPADMATDPIVQFWTMEQLGCYHAMIDFLWQNCGKIDGNSSEFPAKLRRIFRVSHAKRAGKLWENIIIKFEINDGIISHRRVDKEMQAQVESRLRRQAAGKKGAEKRWENKIEPDGIAIFSDMALNGPSSSSSSSTSTTVINKYTLNGVLADACLVGVDDENAKNFYHHYNAQGWVMGNGVPITNIQSALTKWRNNGYKFDRKTSARNKQTGSQEKSLFENSKVGGECSTHSKIGITLDNGA